MQDDDHAPDGGFHMDLNRMLGRRGLLLAFGAAALAGCAAVAQGGPGAPPPSDPQPDVTGTAADGTTCTRPASETNGPYPADGTNVRDGQTVNVLDQTGVERRDITASFNGYAGAVDGIPLDLEVRLLDVGAACAPLAGLAVYVWHCSAEGLYSLYSVPGANWLRGLQVSDAAGMVRFRTILPGTYEGRWPHIHFEVFASPSAALTGRDALLTSQFAIPDNGLAGVYAADPRYAASTAPFARASLPGDNVFGDNSPAQMAAMTLTMTKTGAGYAARGVIGIGG